MKIILSRKGFDSGTGKVPSPILPMAVPTGVTRSGEKMAQLPDVSMSGQLCSLAIPETQTGKHGLCYRDIIGEPKVAKLVQNLTGQKLKGSHCVHLDPDLAAGHRPRLPGWRPCFGQAGAAERHLQNQGVGPEDIFLFFGWFRQVEWVRRRYRYVKHAPDLHVIFGWLQVAERLAVQESGRLPHWARSHPHAQGKPYASADSLYLATQTLRLSGEPGIIPGGGCFPAFHPALCLTDRAGHKRSQWRLPAWFYPFHPGAERTPLSYHGRSDRWQLRDDATLLQSVGRGQEFVLDCDEYPEAIAWLAQLFSLADGSSNKI